MKQAFQLRIGQHLTMTPQMQQAIRLLQMSALELKAEIQTALESNLMLEQVEDDGAAEPEAAAPAEVELPEPGWSSEPSSAYDPPEWQAAAPDGLAEYLRWQVDLTPFTQLDAQIATVLLDYIGDDGYLKVPLDEIQSALPSDLEAGLDEVEAVLHRIQRFDPVGVGARTLSECLTVQLSQLPSDTHGRALAMRIAAEHLEALGAGKLDGIAARLDVGRDAVDQAVALLRSLNPRPGSQIASTVTEYVVPDVLVNRRDDRWVVELNPDLLPRLRINPYYARLARGRAAGDDRDCMRDHLQEARWLLKSLQSRAHTLLKVAGFIVEHQSEYLEHGDTAMRPLVLREVAEALEMHESTVSRVTANKYMHTPRGVVEFRHFFSSQLGGANGGTSGTAARARIRKLISDEDAGMPLSDGRIAELLAGMGLQVARRTVAKYREAMSIPPATERRRSG